MDWKWKVLLKAIKKNWVYIVLITIICIQSFALESNFKYIKELSKEYVELYENYLIQERLLQRALNLIHVFIERDIKKVGTEQYFK